MNWIPWILGAMVGTVVERSLNRMLLKDNPGYWEYMLGYNVGALVFIAFINRVQEVPHFENSALPLLVLAGVCWFLCCLFGFIADTTTGVSITGILSQLQMVFILFGGVYFLGETLTISKIAGTSLIVLGLTILIPKIKLSWNSGVLFKATGTLLGATALLIDKQLLHSFDPTIIAISGYAIPLFLAVLMRPRVIISAFTASKQIYFLNLLMGVLGCATYYMLLNSFKYAPISVAFPVYQLNLVLTLLIGFVILKERDHLWQKVACTLLVILGSVIIQ